MAGNNTPGVIPISSVINVSVQFASSGIPGYNVNNIGLFTTDAFLSNPNTDFWRPYVTAAAVGNDFGFSSETYQQAVNVFAQQPSILNGGGQLIIIPIQTGAITGLNATPTAGGTNYKVGDVLSINQTGGYGGFATVTATAGGIVTSLSLATPGILYTTGTGIAVTGGYGTGCTVAITSVGTETLLNAYNRGNNYLYFNGIIATNYGANSTWVALAAAVQANQNQILFLPTINTLDIYGTFITIQLASDINTRMLYYGSTGLNARLYAAAYASKALSTNWSGSNTTQTMNLQQLVNVVPDTTLTSVILAGLAACGADCYANYGGSYPGVVSVGANKYTDEVTNLVWLVTSLQVAGFNALATVGTKIAQTEAGMSLLKSYYRAVLKQAVSNGYLAPGSWTSADTFGNPTKFLANITGTGFYIYSAPVSQQSTTARAARQAPLVQIAGKEAGAIQSGSILVTINQ
jgi:hypothetical protein